MIQLNSDDLKEIVTDLDGLLDLLIIIESSNYYTKEDIGVYRTLRNSTEFTRDKLNSIIENASKVSNI